MVKKDDKNFNLPNGQHVSSGCYLINYYYEFDLKSDFLIICGGPK